MKTSGPSEREKVRKRMRERVVPTDERVELHIDDSNYCETCRCEWRDVQVKIGCSEGGVTLKRKRRREKRTRASNGDCKTDLMFLGIEHILDPCCWLQSMAGYFPQSKVWMWAMRPHINRREKRIYDLPQARETTDSGAEVSQAPHPHTRPTGNMELW